MMVSFVLIVLEYKGIYIFKKLCLNLHFVLCCWFNKIFMLWFSFLLGGKEPSLCGNVFIGRRLRYLLCILCYTFRLSQIQ